MKVKILENGIELIPENDFDKKAIEKVAQKTITSEYEDAWNKTGNLILTYQKHPWD